MLSQSLMNLVDTALVGHLGESALAAVGSASYAFLLMTALLSGLSAAIQAQVARLQGQKKHQLNASPVNTGLTLSLLFGIPLTALGLYFSSEALALITPTNNLGLLAQDYFDIRVLALPAAAMNLSFRGYWNGTNEPARFVKVLIVVHLMNALISWILIYGKFGLPALGIKGAALGTVIAMYSGAFLNGSNMAKRAANNGFLRILPSPQHCKQLVRLAAPDSLQQFLFSLSLMALFAILAQAGTTAMALGHILINFSLLLILPAIGFGMAATTLVSHALGAKNNRQAQLWGQETAGIAFITLALLNLPIWLFPEQILALFITDQAIITTGVLPLKLTGLGITAEAAGLVLTQALLGAGASRTVMLVRLTGQWLILLPLYWWAVNIMGYGLTAVCIIHALQRAMSSIVFLNIWRKQHWLKKDLVSPVA